MTEKTRLCIAPWYSVGARGFVPRLYLLDESGWPLKHVDGLTVLATYEQAVEAAGSLCISTHSDSAA